MAQLSADQNALTQFKVEMDVPEGILNQVSLVEFSLTESLMSPSLTTQFLVESARHVGYAKNLDEYANRDVRITLHRPDLNETLIVQQKIYKITERDPTTYQFDEFQINACDITLLRNAANRVSQSYKCTSPSAIVSDMLGRVGARSFVEGSSPMRTYFAENVHPFQVIAQQADVAVAAGTDPSFLHYMTYENGGTHRFESLRNMARRAPVREFEYSEKTINEKTYNNPREIMGYSFPCDFDILSDILNSIDIDGLDQNSLIVINPFNGIQSLLGNQAKSGGLGGLNAGATFTNKGSAQTEGNCEIDVEKYKLRRQARLGLLEPDRIPLRITVPFCPAVHVGNVINVLFKNKIPTPNGLVTVPDYGSGTYLVSALTHNIKVGGFATTVMDCVSKSVGFGGATLGM